MKQTKTQKWKNLGDREVRKGVNKEEYRTGQKISERKMTKFSSH